MKFTSFKLVALSLSLTIALPVFAQNGDPWQAFLEQNRQRHHEEDMQKRLIEDAEKTREQSERDRKSRDAMERNRAWSDTPEQPIQQPAPNQYRPKNCMLISNIVHCY